LAELGQFLVGGGVITEEELLISSVGLDPLPHTRGVEEGKIGGQLQERRI